MAPHPPGGVGLFAQELLDGFLGPVMSDDATKDRLTMTDCLVDC